MDWISILLGAALQAVCKYRMFQNEGTAAILASTCRCPKPVLKVLIELFSYVNTHSNKTALLLAT